MVIIMTFIHHIGGKEMKGYGRSRDSISCIVLVSNFISGFTHSVYIEIQNDAIMMVWKDHIKNLVNNNEIVVIVVHLNEVNTLHG